MSTPVDAALRARLSKNLSDFDVKLIETPGLRLAAVAIAVTSGPDGTPAILLTLRPARMGRHAGQYALPGGKVDDGETPEEAAFRELHEELGLRLPEGALIGRLDDYATRSGFRIMTFVLWAGEDVRISPCPDEVAEVHYIPFHELDSDALPHFEDGVPGGHPVLYSQLPTLGHRMYAPTAALLYQFREVALRGQGTRVAHFDQPRFAWS